MGIRRTAQKTTHNVRVCDDVLQLHIQCVSGGGGYNQIRFLWYGQNTDLNPGGYAVILAFTFKSSLRKQGFVSHN